MDYIYAFVTGGAICVVGQLLMDETRLTEGAGAAGLRRSCAAGFRAV